MKKYILPFFTRLGMEPPFRIIVRALLKNFKLSVRTKSHWELSNRPAYILGILAAADQAIKQNVKEISVIEFGVAGGEGLIAMQEHAEEVENELGVGIKVFGFDMGKHGLPEFIGDYRDHPDAWKPGDYPMDEEKLRLRLTDRTSLILGNIKETIPLFFKDFTPPPIGFVSIDLDLYSSTYEALKIFKLPGKKMLWHVPMYFDDIDFIFNHKYAGELLAINEFNGKSENVKIDRWYGVRNDRPFPERSFLNKLYVAHDIESISNISLARTSAVLPIKD